jgi:hypothetical protein
MGRRLVIGLANQRWKASARRFLGKELVVMHSMIVETYGLVNIRDSLAV